MEEQAPNKPLELSKTEKLKLFCVLSTKKTVPSEIIKDSFALVLIAAYTETEAMIATGKGIMASGKNVDDYILGTMRIKVDVESLIDTSLWNAKPEEKQNILPVIVDKKSLEETMIENVRIMFNLVGNPGEKKIAEQVITRFNDYADSKKLSTGQTKTS